MTPPVKLRGPKPRYPAAREVVFRLTVHFEVPYCEDALARWRKRQAELDAGEE